MYAYKKLNKLATIVLIAIVSMGITISTSCTHPLSTPPSTPGDDSALLSGVVTQAGSTTVQPLAEKLADAFRWLYPNVTVTIQGGGSSVGVKTAADGTVDIGAASRELKPEEPRLISYLIAHSGLAIITHPSNTLAELTKEDVRRIFAGEIRRWDEVGGSNDEIIVVAREEGSGARHTFEKEVMKESLITNRALLQPASGAIRNIISMTPGSIGFLSFNYLDSLVKALAIDGTEATADNIISGTYTMSQPFYFLTRDEPNSPASDFIGFCLSPDGQSIVRSEGYISVE